MMWITATSVLAENDVGDVNISLTIDWLGKDKIPTSQHEH